MRLYIAKISEVLPQHLELVSPGRREKALRYRFEDDQKRCVAGGILMDRFLGGAEIFDNGFGKPSARGVSFNLSHSGEYVLLAVGESELGCDLEKHRYANAEKMGKYVFCEREMEKLRAAFDKNGEFFELWTKKEALLKCMGKGFHREAKSVDVSGGRFFEDGVTYFLKTIRFSDYTISLCSVKDFSVDIEFVRI